MKINNFNFLSFKVVQINFSKCNFALSNCQAGNDAMPERPDIKYKAGNNCMAKLSIVFVSLCKCDCLPFMASSMYLVVLLKLVFTVVSPAIAYIN